VHVRIPRTKKKKKKGRGGFSNNRPEYGCAKSGKQSELLSRRFGEKSRGNVKSGGEKGERLLQRIIQGSGNGGKALCSQGSRKTQQGGRSEYCQLRGAPSVREDSKNLLFPIGLQSRKN